MRGVSHVQGEGRGVGASAIFKPMRRVRGVSPVQGDGVRGVSHVQGDDKGGVRGVSHSQGNGRQPCSR